MFDFRTRWQTLRMIGLGSVVSCAVAAAFTLAGTSVDAQSQAIAAPTVDVGDLSPGGPALSLAAREAMVAQFHARREMIAAASPATVEGLPVPSNFVAAGRESGVAAMAVDVNEGMNALPGDLLFGRNNTYTPVGFGVSNTSEPATANDGPLVFYTTNWSAGTSADGGATWANFPIAGGPADAPNFCCDSDVTHDRARGVTFWSTLYLNAAQTHGIVSIFLKSSPTAAPFCRWNINYGATITPDFPHIALTNDYLHLTTNNISNGVAWSYSSDFRMNIEDLIACGAVPLRTNFFAWVGAVGQRVFRPADGGREVMYFGAPETSTSFRVFHWRDAAAAPTNALIAMAASTFANPDCRGGNNNVDQVERGTAWSIQGFTVSGAVGRRNDSRFVAFYWNVAADANHPQGHVHGVAVAEGSLGLLANLAIWNADMCWSFPAAGANDRGDIGLAAAFGGHAGGGGGAATAAKPTVGISDEFASLTPGAPPGTFFVTFGSTDNSPRYGDFLTVRTHDPCSLAFDAATYGVTGATKVRKYTEFYRGRDNKCYIGRRNTLP
jgi:hypothetical protein